MQMQSTTASAVLLAGPSPHLCLEGDMFKHTPSYNWSGAYFKDTVIASFRAGEAKGSEWMVPAAQVLMIGDLQALAGQDSGCSLLSRLPQLRWPAASLPASLSANVPWSATTHRAGKPLNGSQTYKGGSV